MIKALERIFLYWNRPIYEPTAQELADIEAMQQLITQLQAYEREIGHCIICELPEFGCGF